MSEFKAVQLKRSTTAGVVPDAAQLVEGELAINLIDKKLYSKNSSTVFELKGTVDDGTITTPKLASGVASTIVTAALNAVYPIGSVYTNINVSTNPATLLGIGTWVAIQGRVIVGLDPAEPAFDTLGETGGSKDAVVVSHTHTGTTGGQSNDHTHQYGSASNYGSGQPSSFDARNTGSFTTTGTSADHTHNFTTSATGSSATNANLQPYVVAYVWKRTA